jgi:hypothetical protein
MANEFLKRTPTSGGNRRVFTISAWTKINETNGANILGNSHGSGSTFFTVRVATDGNTNSVLVYTIKGGTDYSRYWNLADRDPSSWIHHIFAFDTTALNVDDRVIYYRNGAKVTAYSDVYGSIPRNYEFDILTSRSFDIFKNGDQSTFGKGQIFDYFFVDGQQLTPDVFGFYKDGDGYQSVGTGEASNFKPGQWSPRLPKSIKYTINRSGGFGVNGLYLPMNDSSNPGADFHCASNSIIKLKGEDLPQPQNGAPITSDAFVSQLRQETGTLGFDGCVKIDADGDYLTVPSSSDFAYGTGDFTWEAFVFTSALSNDSASANYLFDHDQDGGVIQFYDGLIRYYNTTLGVTGNLYTKGGGLQSSTWHHVAVARQSGTTRLFVDGELRTSEADGHDYPAQAVTIGDFGGHSGANEWDGFISNARIIKGTALYTANFTAPTEPLTNVTNTKLLCCNSSTSATAATVTPGTITANGDVFATRNELTGSTVFAIPGISTSTSQDFYTNGNFETGIGGWNSGNGATVVYQASSGPSGNGCVRVTSPANSSNGYTFRALDSNLEVGKRYTLSFYYQHVSGGEGYVNIGNSTGASQIVYRKLDNSNTNWNQIHISFVAEVVGTFIGFYSKASSGVVRFANISLVQEDAARDYSADIIGSGTNKTVNTVTYPDSNNSDHRVPAIVSGHSPYGSYINYDSPGNTGGYIEVADSTAFDNLNLTTAEWTYEAWYKRGIISGGASNLVQFGNAIDYQTFGVSIHPTGRLYYVWSYDGSNWDVLSSSDGPVIPQDEWCHIAIVKEATPTPRIVTYVNGVFAKSVNVTSNISYTSPDYMRIGGHYKGTGGGGDTYFYNGGFFDARFYSTVKYKGGFDVPKPYTPVGIEPFRTTDDTCKNNFATWNVISNHHTDPLTLSNGNLTMNNYNVWRSVLATHGVSSGKWYYEMKTVDDSQYLYIGWGNSNANVAQYPSEDNNGWAMRIDEPKAYHDQTGDNTQVPLSPAFTQNDIAGCAFDADNGRIWWSRNGVWLTADGNNDGNPATGSKAIYSDIPTGVTYHPMASVYNETARTNFGQNPTFSGTVTAGTNADDSGKGLFKYAPPTGFLALCTDNLPDPVIADPGKHFKTVTWIGDGTDNRSITGLGFKPDFVWIKVRTAVNNNYLFDIVRGADQVLYSDDDNEEVDYTTSGGRMPSFDSDGFTVNYSSSTGTNNSGSEYVAWCWKAGGAAVSNTDGSVTSQVSVNQTAGFSIVSYTGTGAAISVGHGLEKAPAFIISKNRSIERSWPIYHQSTSNIGTSAVDVVYLDLIIVGTADNFLSVNDTTFSTTTWNGVSGDGNEHIAYCWSEIEGYSKFGSYTGNANADGPFVYCGFRPSWVLIKNINTANSHWVLWDSSRAPYNEMDNALRPDGNYTETAGFQFDFVSNGFKVRDGELSVSESGDTFIFAAFAESPFQTANAR